MLPWSRLRPITRDVLVAAATAILQCLVQILAADHGVPAFVLVLAVACAVPLAVPAHPLLVLSGAVGLDTTLLAVAGGSGWLPVATLVALYRLAVSGETRVTWSAGPATAAWLVIAGILWRDGPWLTHLIAFDYALVALALGTSVRNRHRYVAEAIQHARIAQEMRAEETRTRIREERIRIARDLHDEVAHHITLVHAQAAVARYLMPTGPSRDSSATDIGGTLQSIEETSARALNELRATVSLLANSDGDSAPLRPTLGFADRQSVIDEFRAAGLRVQYSEAALPTILEPAADQLAHRVLREGLANALKHGSGRSVEVSARGTERTVVVTIVNPAVPGLDGHGNGLGLRALRDGITRIGGELVAGYEPSESGGAQHRLQATVPTKGAPA